MTQAVTATRQGVEPGSGPQGRRNPTFWEATAAMRVYLSVMVAAAVAVPLLVWDVDPVGSFHPMPLTLAVLVGISVLNVEISRLLSGGLARTQQPHKALSAWAFATVLLLPVWCLLVVVPITYAHARWRGLRVPLFKWVGSGALLVLAGLAAALARSLVWPDGLNWMDGNGGRGLVTILVAAAAFLAVETVLFHGCAYLNHPEDEAWLRQTLRSPSYYGTEVGVLVIGGLMSAVWTAGGWFTLALVPVYVLVQRASLHEPLRQRAEAAAQLAERNVELEHANQFKLDLVSMLGHEIGNPLTSVTGYSQVGLEALTDDDEALARKAFEVVERSAAQIRNVLGEILTMVSSDRGALTALPEVCAVRPRLEAAVAAQPLNRHPTVQCDPELTAYVQPGHLDQMLSNLLSNANKYADGATRLAARATVEGNVELRVEDDGRGIPDAFRERLFARFSRDAGTARDVVGTGLGLFITRELARANGGEITYEERQPSGSVFVVTLPGSPR